MFNKFKYDEFHLWAAHIDDWSYTLCLIWFSRLALLADASEEADVCLRSNMAITDEPKVRWLISVTLLINYADSRIQTCRPTRPGQTEINTLFRFIHNLHTCLLVHKLSKWLTINVFVFKLFCTKRYKMKMNIIIVQCKWNSNIWAMRKNMRRYIN